MKENRLHTVDLQISESSEEQLLHAMSGKTDAVERLSRLHELKERLEIQLRSECEEKDGVIQMLSKQLDSMEAQQQNVNKLVKNYTKQRLIP